MTGDKRDLGTRRQLACAANEFPVRSAAHKANGAPEVTDVIPR
jgi:hypothetical protein